MVSETEQIEFYDQIVNDPIYWEMRAADLMHASKILRSTALEAAIKFGAAFSTETPMVLTTPKPGTDEPLTLSCSQQALDAMFAADKHKSDIVALLQSVMLQAFAAECYLKCLWLTKGNDLASGGKYQGVARSENHDLSKISGLVGFALLAGESEVLDFLSVIGKGFGRYPAPKKYQDRPLKPNSAGIPTLGTWDDRHHEIAEGYILRLRDEITSARNKEQQTPG